MSLLYVLEYFYTFIYMYIKIPLAVATTDPLSPLHKPNVVHQHAFTLLTPESKPSSMPQRDRDFYIQRHLPAHQINLLWLGKHVAEKGFYRAPLNEMEANLLS